MKKREGQLSKASTKKIPKLNFEVDLDCMRSETMSKIYELIRCPLKYYLKVEGHGVTRKQFEEW
jgi:hypothetical protein